MRRIQALLAGFLIFCPNLTQANVITPGVLTSPAANSFWNGDSWDGFNLNVGNLFPGNPFYSINQNPVGLSFFIQGAITFTVLYELGDYQTLNKFGWFQVSNPANSGIIFPGSSIPGSTLTLFFPFQFGFFIESPAGRFDSQNQSQNFALFKLSPNQFILGMEDLIVSKSDRDYNDLIIKIEYDEIKQVSNPNPIPEPTSLILLSSGLLILIRKLKNY